MIKPLTFLDRNGLVDGNIPAGKPCPFLSRCRRFDDRCPSPENPRPVPFSCACARAFSITEEPKRSKG